MLNNLLIKRGYSLTDINNMECDEYNFLINLNLATLKPKDNIFTGGI